MWFAVRAVRRPLQCGAADIGLLRTVTRGSLRISGDTGWFLLSPSLRNNTAIAGHSTYHWACAVDMLKFEFVFLTTPTFNADSYVLHSVAGDAPSLPGERGPLPGRGGRAHSELQVM